MPELRLEKARNNYVDCCVVCLTPLKNKTHYHLKDGEACEKCFDEYIDRELTKK